MDFEKEFLKGFKGKITRHQRENLGEILRGLGDDYLGDSLVAARTVQKVVRENEVHLIHLI